MHIKSKQDINTNLRELYIEINKNGIITLITPNCYNILGYSQNEIMNTNIST